MSLAWRAVSAPSDFSAWQLRRVPVIVLGCVLGLFALGLSGIQRADEMSLGTDFADRQFVWGWLALAALIGAASLSYRQWKPYSNALFVLTLPLLVVVFFMPAKNGARCWIPLGAFDVQPSELAKLTFILGLAHYLMHRDNYRKLTGLIAPFLIAVVPTVLILREPDLGSAMVFPPVLFAMLFAAGAKRLHLAAIVLLAVAMTPLFWQALNAEQRSRITALFTQVDSGPNPLGDRYHQHQSKLVIALGGVWGSELSGMPLEDPSAYRLFAGQTDFVFSWVCERWGLWGGLLTLSLYALLYIQGFLIAGSTREPFGRLIAVGVTTQLASQTLINTGMAVGLMPVAGITLPLMSYGGSSLLSTAAGLGLLINVALRPGYEIGHEPFAFRDVA
jgi:cell division protein FtsW (lipid II flippase)